MDSATEVRYGGVVVGRSPQVRDRDDAGAFIVFGEPLPVGTRIALKIDDKDQHARVTEVVESADASVAGMRVRFVSAAERDGSGPVKAAVPAAAAPTPVAAEPSQPAASAVPVPVAGGESSSAIGSTGVPAGESSAHPADPNAPHHEGEGGGRRRRRRK